MKKITYLFKSILLNGRTVEINNILLGNITTHSDFENNTINFIQDWLNNVESFTLNTSGSTGSAKEIIITREQINHSAEMTIGALGLERGDTALVCLNINYIAGKMMLARALVGNMKIVATEPTSNPLLKTKEHFDFTALVPFQLEAILKSDEHLEQINKGKAILIGGAAISQSLQKIIKLKIKVPLYATYGMTETISHIALQRLNGLSQQQHFKLLPGIKIHLDKRECLTIEAPYLNEKIITNDLVKIVGEDEFVWLGRYDNIINTGGIKVLPEEIESVIQKLLASNNIEQLFFIAGVPDNLLGLRIVLIVEGDIDQNWVNILIMLKQSFSKYVIPKQILNLKKFIYTKTEKIDRSACLQLIMAQYFTI